MNTSDIADKEHYLFGLAFELAYWLHVNKDIAFFIAEDALDALHSTLGSQRKNRKPSGELKGFWKWGVRTRPIRKTVSLSDTQMLQWLVYKESERWERQTERGEGPYAPTEEDLIVRYIKYLTFICLRRDSFYISIAVGGLLHQFDRRETRLFYDILTQSDVARMKDTNYIGKQRLEMIERILRRFNGLIMTTKGHGDEKQFVKRPTTQWSIDLVNECLRRFTPWETTCVLEPGFDITDIPGLYFSEGGDKEEEDLITINRIHTVLDPHCFKLFVDGLSKYVRSLPKDNQDRRCDYSLPEERLCLPKFSNVASGPSRGDRFQCPPLTREDYIRLQRTLDARGHRRKHLSLVKVHVYIDDQLRCSFDPRKERERRNLIVPKTSVVELVGEDDIGPLKLLTFLTPDPVRSQAFKESVKHPGGQKITISGRHHAGTNGDVSPVELSISLSQSLLSQARRRVSAIVGHPSPTVDGEVHSNAARRYMWQVGLAAAAALIMLISAVVIWRNFSASQTSLSGENLNNTNLEAKVPELPAQSSKSPPVPDHTPSPKEVRQSIAQMSWSVDRETALKAIQIESTRSETQVIDLRQQRMNLHLSIPAYDENGQVYRQYRFSIAAADQRVWTHSLGAPRTILTGYANVLNLTIFTSQLTQAETYRITVEGRTKATWRSVGHLTLRPK